MPEQLTTQEAESRFWVRYGAYLHGQPRKPQSVEEWLNTARQIRGIQSLDELATRLEKAASVQSLHNSPQKRQRVAQAADIHYDSEGQPCCPIHERPLKQGKFGWYCSAKDEKGRNGYCDFRTKEI